MDPAKRTELLDRYRNGYNEVVDAVRDISHEELDARGGSSEWSARQVVHHLADSEMTSAIRLRRLIAEEGPRIDGYDEERFAQRLHYDRPIGTSLDALRAARESTAEILDRLSEDEWARVGTHAETGAYGVETWLETYAAHAHEHAEQIRRARSSGR